MVRRSELRCGSYGHQKAAVNSARVDSEASDLLSYRTTPQSSIGETPFRLTYGVEAIIPVEKGEPSPRLLLGPEDAIAERNLIDEVQTEAHLAELAL
ncbi:hypothetical protein PIB30_100392 [Stylosanthes scabra]|uniref:Uncharacterized protein n=1 Tax=Stylosanthes scabra TaxID=79078 RepID=A0ABU6XWQ2_9FABA|nr:hypothetical protein [Stylosanthes scabra]